MLSLLTGLVMTVLNFQERNSDQRKIQIAAFHGDF